MLSFNLLQQSESCLSVFLCYLNCVFRTAPSRLRLRRALRFQFSNWFSVPACFPPLPPAPAHRPSDTFHGKKEMSKQTSKGNLLDTSIMNGFEIITQLGGYIILFSILSGLLMDLHPFGSASPLLCGVLEIDDGIAQLAASSLPYAGKVSAVLTCAAFGGLSVAAQTNCMIHNSGLPLWPYLAGKLCCAAFAGTLGLFLFAFLF